MIFRSLHAKLVATYLLILVLLLSGLAITLNLSYKNNLTDSRNEAITACARQIAEMYAAGELGIIDMENTSTIPVLKTMAKDYDATIQLVNASSKRIFYSIDKEGMTVLTDDTFIADDVFTTVYDENRVYLHSNYYNVNMDAYVSTIAYPIRAINSETSEKPWAILIINSNFASVKETYEKITDSLFLPAILFGLAGLAMTLILINGIVRRVKQLNNATKLLAQGKFDTRVQMKHHDEISELAESFNTMAAELKKSDASKRDFVSNAAHELRSPMTSINGFVEGMLDGTIPPEKHTMYLEIVSSEVKRLTKLIKSMLDLSRIESGREKITIQKMDINELIRRVVIRFSQKIENKGIIPEIDITEGKMLVNADCDKIEEVMQNLVDNAIKFTGEGKKLTLSCKRNGNKAVVSVKDEGAGITTEDLQFIWDRFYTVDKAHTGHKSGTGLGLAIVKSIIEQHGQQINVTSEVGKGTEFTFTLECAGE